MNLRLLIASDHYPPFIGGAHRQTQLLGKELRRRGHEVSIVTPWQPSVDEQEDDEGVPIYRLREMRTLVNQFVRPKGQRHHPPYPDPVMAIGLRRLIDRLAPDIIHAHGWISFSCAAALLGKNIPLIISTRDYGYSCATRTLLWQDQTCDGPALGKCTACALRFYGGPRGYITPLSLAISRPILLRKLRGVHSVSKFVEGIVERDLIRDSGLHFDTQGGNIQAEVISSFLIEEEHEQPDAEILAKLPQEPFILFVGGLQTRKGFGTLLAAYERLIAPPPLVLIGYQSGEPLPSLPAGVSVLYNVPHATVMAAWQRSSFGVMPSVWPDPSPGVVREAMRSGKAVIGTNTGGTTEMILDGVSGLLVPPNDVFALASAMQKLSDDPDLCLQLGRAARERSHAFMADVSVARFEKLYSSVLGALVGRSLQHRNV